MTTYKKSLSRRITTSIVDTVIPYSCPICGSLTDAKEEYRCRICVGEYHAFLIEELLCPQCGGRIPFGIIHPRCLRKTGLRRFFYVASYRQKWVRNLVFRFKYAYTRLDVNTISELLKERLQRVGVMDEIKKSPHKFMMIPVPLALRKLRSRGFNQAELIGDQLARALGISLECDMLFRTRSTTSQSDLQNNVKKKENVKNAFAVKDGVKLRRNIVLLIDDVATSGATLEECAKILKENGAKEVWGVVFAKG